MSVGTDRIVPDDMFSDSPGRLTVPASWDGVFPVRDVPATLLRALTEEAVIETGGAEPEGFLALLDPGRKIIQTDRKNGLVHPPRGTLAGYTSFVPLGSIAVQPRD